MAGLIYKAARSVAQLICRIFGKAIGCLTRLKKKSPCDTVTLSDIGIVSNRDKPEDLVTWSSWDDVPIVVTHSAPIIVANPAPKIPDSVQLKIEEYREKKMSLKTETDYSEAIDYFQDMAPNITRQEKILISGPDDEESALGTPLLTDDDLPSPELGVWEENGHWEESPNDWSMFEIIRETKKEEPPKEQPAKKQGKDSQPKRGGYAKLP